MLIRTKHRKIVYIIYQIMFLQMEIEGNSNHFFEEELNTKGSMEEIHRAFRV